MLNLGFNVDINVKKVELPFYFDRRNECVSCGGKNTLEFVDKFGRKSKQEIRAFDHIQCKKCGRIDSILWKQDENSNKMYPSAVDPSISRDFMNMVDSSIKSNGVKSLD